MTKYSFSVSVVCLTAVIISSSYPSFCFNIGAYKITMKDILLGILSVVCSFLLTIILVSIGWYITWKLFLSRFKFVRELMGNEVEKLDNKLSNSRSSRTKKSRLE